MKIGAKGKYEEWLEPDNLLILRAMARDGKSKAEIAQRIGIRRQTLFDWIKRFPDIGDALKRGKEPYDIEIEDALHDSAKGYYVTVREPMKLKRVKQKQGEGRIEEEYVEYVERQIYIPPQTAAQIFYLKNRKAKDWREKREVVADVADNAFRNMQTIASLINHPVKSVDIEDLAKEAREENDE